MHVSSLYDEKRTKITNIDFSFLQVIGDM